MTEPKETYKKPTEAHELSPGLVKYLDGSRLSERVGEAIRVTTVDEDGWPHAALLSVGEILAVDQKHLNFAIWANSKTTKNIERTGRISIAMVHEGALWEVNLNC
jgi:flavin reductase (DIM6/NTAB) family NADH-FMN oxidoreductase RutF